MSEQDNVPTPGKVVAIATVPTERPNTIYLPGMFEQAQRYAKQLANSGMVPTEYRGNVANCLIALEMSARFGDSIGVLQVMQCMYVVHGRPTWSAQFIAARVNTSALFERIKYRKGTGDRGDWCQAFAVERATGDVLEGPVIDMQLARDEGWMSNKKWHSMADQMRHYRAAAWWARRHCPGLLLGMYATDELEQVDEPDYRKDYRDVAIEASVSADGAPEAVAAVEPTPAPPPVDAEDPVEAYLRRGAKLRNELVECNDPERAKTIIGKLSGAQVLLPAGFVDERITLAIERLGLPS